jgi:ATP-dependent RNA helicase RhlE
VHVKFEQSNLDSRLLTAVRSAGYQQPTPIQAQAIPPAMEGRDLIGLARTGTGKTAAFALPMLHRLLAAPGRGGVRALVIAPTRELAAQIGDVFDALGAGTGFRTALVFGGVGMNPQVEKLRRGVETVVACPGRLLDHLRQKTADLSRVEILVLDEADRLFDMGFLPDVRRILSHLPRQRQTMLFSATMPDEIRKLAHEILRDPVTVQVSSLRPVETVAHALYPVPQHLKTPLLLEILQRTPTGSVIVFTKTKHRAKKVAQQLALAGHQATCLQGNLSQNRRMEAMGGFRDGSYRILVATDIASRGIDVAGISHVINYDIPDTEDAYTHRIGRTGRVENTGDAFTFVTGEDEAMVRAIERVLGQEIERITLEGFDYRAPAPPKAPATAPRVRHAAPAQASPAERSAGEPRPAGRRRHQEPRPVPAASPRRATAPSAGSAVTRGQGHTRATPSTPSTPAPRPAGSRGQQGAAPPRSRAAEGPRQRRTEGSSGATARGSRNDRERRRDGNRVRQERDGRTGADQSRGTQEPASRSAGLAGLFSKLGSIGRRLATSGQ